MKRRFTNFILVLVFLAGLSLLLYPTVSDWWNSMHQSRAVASYNEQISKIDPAIYDQIRESAQEYNRNIPRDATRFKMSDEQRELYNQELNLGGNGIMGIIDIPELGVEMPIYHGTSEGVLQVAIGHIEGTSLPVGGLGTHAALSGHRGLPSARLFTDLDKMELGDTFMLEILDEVLTYQVDQILIVKPHELDDLAIEEGQDFCTLVTCTPYGINSHRMLVRGRRVETEAPKAVIRISADALRIDPLIVAPILAAPILLALLLIVVFYNPKKRR